MKEALKQGSIRFSRRTFLGRALAAIFGVFAGLSVGVPRVMAAGCSGPYGTGYCGRSLCRGYRCSNSYYTSCGYVRGFCRPGSACWSSGGGTCCDCQCYNVGGGATFYCYCSSK
jgi:hypothetical protein